MQYRGCICSTYVVLRIDRSLPVTSKDGSMLKDITADTGHFSEEVEYTDDCEDTESSKNGATKRRKKEVPVSTK